MFQLNGNSIISNLVLIRTLIRFRMAEQLDGLQCEECGDEIDVIDDRIRGIEEQDRKMSHYEKTKYLLAKTCFDVKEYLRVADILKKASSPKCKFLKRYSLFLAGEKQKDEEHQELKGECSVINCELKNLFQELKKEYEEQTLDVFGKYLFGVVLKELHLDSQALSVLIDCCNSFPWNWSSWIALGSLCADTEILQKVQSQLQTHYMTEFFNALTHLDLQMNEEALNSYDSLTSLFPSSRYIVQQIATCQFNLQGKLMNSMFT